MRDKPCRSPCPASFRAHREHRSAQSEQTAREHMSTHAVVRCKLWRADAGAKRTQCGNINCITAFLNSIRFVWQCGAKVEGRLRCPGHTQIKSRWCKGRVMARGSSDSPPTKCNYLLKKRHLHLVPTVTGDVICCTKSRNSRSHHCHALAFSHSSRQPPESTVTYSKCAKHSYVRVGSRHTRVVSKMAARVHVWCVCVCLPQRAPLSASLTSKG